MAARSDRAALVVTAAHPGWTRSDLQRYSGLLRFLNRFLSQEPCKGAPPIPRATIDPSAKSVDHFGP